jgi:hypothetical protein
MKFDLPEQVSQEKIEIDVRDIEAMLQGPAMKLPPFGDATVKLKDGRTLYIREARRDEAPKMMEYMKRIMEVDHDFYDIVGARVYSEILGWYRHRLKDPYTLVGLIDGVWAGFANGRVMNEKVNISLHTVALDRGGRIGAVMYYAKAYYAFEMIKNTEWWATYESYNGWSRWGLGMAQPSYPWPEVQHELGGARVYYVTKNYWDQLIKDYVKQMAGGAELDFNVPDSIRKANENFTVPEGVNV